MQVIEFNCNDEKYEELRTVWCEVFGDEPSFVDRLYNSLNARGYAIKENGVLCSFLTLYEAGELDDAPVLVSYGVCTGPEFRGQGYAGRLVEFVRNKVVKGGAVSLVCPAEPTLEKFYGRLGYKAACYARTEAALRENLNLQVQILRADHYNTFREQFLSNTPHVQFNDRFMKFIQDNTFNSQELLLINNGDAICAVDYRTDNKMNLSELLVNPALSALNSEITEQLAGGLAHHFAAKKCHYRSTASIVYTDDNGDHFAEGSFIQAMTSGAAISPNKGALLPYYGFPID